MTWAVLTCTVMVVVGLSLGSGCPGGTPPPVGDPAAGQALFAQRCASASCHPNPATLKSVANLIVNNLGTVNPVMTGITLTDQQVADLKAYLAGL